MNGERPSNRALTRSFANAFRGLFLFFRSQRNARIHAVAALAAGAAAWGLGFEAWKKSAIVFCIGLVLVAEAFNSALERLADRVTGEVDPLIRDAKDLAAAAVLIAAIVSVAVAAILFLGHFVNLFDASVAD